MRRVVIIGAGFSGLSAACFLAKEGYEVTVLEKNEAPGGRARRFHAEGFTFDMGPSWYWMPDVFENFFSHFNKKPSDYYELIRLDPSYQIIYGPNDNLKVPAREDSLLKIFESIEPGASKMLSKFLAEAGMKYDLAMKELVFRPGLSLTEFFSYDLLKGLLRLHIFESMSAHVRRFFTSPKLIQLLEFPVLFLGAKPERIPSLYSMMNYADIVLGTWYPMGGIYKIIEAMVSLATSMGVQFQYSSPVERIETSSTEATGVIVDGEFHPFDYVVASADYHHVEQELLPLKQRRYDESYWNKQVLAPSSMIYYLGVNKRIAGLAHHNLFFDEDFTQHAVEIYDKPQWPSAPQFYVCCPSKTDRSTAPPGCENIFILIPVATGLTDTESIRNQYLVTILDRVERATGESISEHIVFSRSYAHADFIEDYNAYKGNAYGLANTLMQTANLKPSIVNKKLRNLFYTGQLTVPGPGVPPAIISGQIAATQLIKTNRELVTS